MATLQDWTNFQNDLMTQYQTLFAFSDVLLSLMSGAVKDPNGVATYDPSQERITRFSAQGREIFDDGAKIRVPLMMAEVAGASGTGRGGTFAVTSPISTNKVTASLAELTSPIGVDLYLANQAQNGSLTARGYIETLTDSAYRSLARIENDMLYGSGDGSLAFNTAGDATGLTMTVGTSVNWNQLTPGRVVSVRVAATGADPGQGLRRKIASVNKAGGTITFDTNQVASDGGFGNIAFATAAAGTYGVYMDLTYDQAAANGKAIQGLAQATALTGTFEGLDKAANAQWQGVHVDGASAPLSNSDLDNACYQLAANGLDAPAYGVGHPACVDVYKNSLQQFLKVTPQEATVRSGWRGIVYQGANRDVPIIKDLAAPRKTVFLNPDPGPAGRLYGNGAGPEFVQDDGGQWRFFTRSTYKEAVIVDWVQFGVGNCGHFAKIDALTEAYTP